MPEELPLKSLQKAVDWSVQYPRAVMLAVAGLLVVAGSQIPRIAIDTDPENMLPADQSARVLHNEAKETFKLYDLIVVGVVNESDPDGVFNPASLARIHDLTRAIERIDGVLRQDLLSLSTVDNISQGGPGVVRFEWLMSAPPETREEAHAIRAAAERIPLIDGTLLSEDGRAVAIFVPIEAKSESHRIATAIEEVIAGLGGDEEYHITGIPVAEDTFGVEMFKQMGIAAPAAGLIVFLLMWAFFRSVALIIAPMIVATVTVTVTMGLLIGLGFTVHIMSSMIPIFLMPIAVVDSVHILSEFADQYHRVGDRHKTIRMVMRDLLTPMYYTSLTSAAGFASLAFAPIPPVRVFGVFVAIGITLAFFLTITFIPAYIVRLSDERIAKLKRAEGDGHEHHLLARTLAGLGPKALSASKVILTLTVVVVVVSAYGISLIEVNDNPVRWFRPSHPIRVADRVLNEHFSGTYSAFLILEHQTPPGRPEAFDTAVTNLLGEAVREGDVDLTGQWSTLRESVEPASASATLTALIDAVWDRLDQASDDEAALWDAVLVVLEDAQTNAKVFQTPDALAFIGRLQAELTNVDVVGKSSSVADIVKTVHRELREGDPRYFSIPPTASGVAQTLLSYESSHRPQDLWHFLRPDYRAAAIWVQLTSGDNQDMLRVTSHLDGYLAENPPPEGMSVNWAGLTYLNVVWQNDMVNGMLRALLGSFVIVFVMMLVLFRSAWFALLAMLPLSVTIGLIYGVIGLAGKDYVLSALTLGLSVDFAIHFLQRLRAIHQEEKVWRRTIERLFEEPARAITRNAIVIAVGFLPLLASPLVPYNTVGFFLAAIMVVSCAVTLIFLPSVMGVLSKRILTGGA
jgi:predicted RND superfamily exporter protein